MKLQCAGCGAPLKITPDLGTLACSYCGTTPRVKRKGGIVAKRRCGDTIHLPKAQQSTSASCRSPHASPRVMQTSKLN
jgi:DNA-directed RNA polymerase subunit RPC12/RpoP